MKWYVNILDMRGHADDISFGDRLSDSDCFGPFDNAEEAIDEWMKSCREMHEDAAYVMEDEHIEGKCDGGIVDGRIVLRFDLESKRHVRDLDDYRLFGEIFYMTSGGEDCDFKTLQSCCYAATDYDNDI